MARLITKEEAKRMGLRPMGKKHPVHFLIDELEKGEILHITRDDFRWKRSNPSVFVRRIMKATSKKFTTSKIKSGLGWVVERIK